MRDKQRSATRLRKRVFDRRVNNTDECRNSNGKEKHFPNNGFFGLRDGIEILQEERRED